VLSAILRTGVKWGYLRSNPAQGLDLPQLRTVREKQALTVEQAGDLLAALPLLPRVMVGLCLMTGIRRGELFALRWRDIHEGTCCLRIEQAVYEGVFGSPKTVAGRRQVPLPGLALSLLDQWRSQAKHVSPEILVFATRSGKPISPNNILRRFVYPTCQKLEIPRASWLTFRRTYSSWAHAIGVPQKVIAELMGHANVYTTLNVYTEALESSLQSAVNRIGENCSRLFTLVQ